MTGKELIAYIIKMDLMDKRIIFRTVGGNLEYFGDTSVGPDKVYFDLESNDPEE